MSYPTYKVLVETHVLERTCVLLFMMIKNKKVSIIIIIKIKHKRLQMYIRKKWLQKILQ